MKQWYGMTLHEASEQALRLQDACTLVANHPFAPPAKRAKTQKTSIVRSAQMKFFGVVRNFGQDEILMI
jgi:hypothetical protein